MHPIEIIAIVVFFVGFYGLTTNRNIIKTIIFSSMMEVAVVMFWLAIGFREGVVAPIVATMEGIDDLDQVADPLTQALMITAIVIGISVTAIKATMFVTLYRKHKTADWDIAKARNLEIQ